ncbi:LOW QUALITY PROTEIN: kunitz-type protease inhibitor 2 [Ascaphus truei]|uniref:LOW QUALITY PROTEIN: kunitz-type protease inhibitor 2 n=1 Tax=Ascaphus truei TaxID=8439 RepID=UPI003F59E0FC
MSVMAVSLRCLGLLALLLAAAESEPEVQCSLKFEVLEGYGLKNVGTPTQEGVMVLDSAEADSDEACWARCCANVRCNLAVREGGGRERCHLLDCVYNGFNVCELRAKEGDRSYQQRESGIKPTQQDFCLAEAVVGECRAAFLRWSYDAVSQTCTNFTYGGCNGNLNNYLGEEECMNACRGFKVEKSNGILPPSKRMVEASARQACEGNCTTGQFMCQNGCCIDDFQKCDGSKQCDDGSDEASCDDFCIGKGETGRCRAAFIRFYFDSESKTCSSFVYGGCGGSKNNHKSKKDCLDKCLVSKPEKVYTSGTISFKESCAAPSYTGPCRAAFPRWYYDTTTHTCTKFTYGGCQKNNNNYRTEEECNQTCVGRSEDDDGSVDHSVFHHSTTSVALAVLLAVMAAMLLGAMVVFFVKMAKRNHRDLAFGAMWSPIDDKECLMNNAYTL